MKKKYVIVGIIAIGLIVLCLNITTPKQRLNRLLEKMSDTNEIVIGYSELSYNLKEEFESSGLKYSVVGHITDKEKVQEIINLYSNVKSISNYVDTADLNISTYILRFLNKDGNVILESTFTHLKDSKYAELFEMSKNNQNKLQEIINSYIKINLGCVKEKIMTYITTEDANYNIVSIDEVTDLNVDYSEIIKSNVGHIYAIVKGNNEVIKDFDNYFKKNYKGYKKIELNQNYIVYVYSKNNINIEELRKCENK